ncbi:MAG: PhoH family protein [Prevotellaceae bacterium]|nr:PhoH family protein [Prevotellaceae bacterium]
MIEKHIVIDEIDPRVLYGANNTYLRMLKALYPKLRIVARDNVIKAIGDELAITDFESTIELLISRCAKYNTLRETDIIDIVKGKKPYDEEDEGVIVYDIKGRPIRAKTENQQMLVKAYNKQDLMFVVGPAGTGKTYTAIALAVKALKNKEVRRLILSRPAVEAGEKLGFLPGDMKEKIDPYLRPLYDALEEMIQPARLKEMLEDGTIQIAPLAFMRGRTLSDAVVILDEAQNTTSAQIKMFLTRMGSNTKMIVTGDCTQIDLPVAQRSGLEEAMRILKGVKGISLIEMNKKDIVRNPLVTRIVDAYEKDNEMKKVNINVHEDPDETEPDADDKSD